MATEQVDLTLQNMNDSLFHRFKIYMQLENFHFKNAGDCKCIKGKNLEKDFFLKGYY
jgi:hypothetical protein